MLSEKEIDPLIERAFNESPDFVTWFLSKTSYKNVNAKCVWSRSDHPWGKIAFEYEDPKTGGISEIVRDSETDVLVVLESEQGKRFAFHIENKLADGSFTLYQPEMYKPRARAWLKSSKHGLYTEFETVLFSPIAFYKKNMEAARKFDRYITYEEASIFIPELQDNCKWPVA